MLNTLFEQVWTRRYVFLGTFFLVFTLTYIVLLAVDLLPEPPAENGASEVRTEETLDAEGLQTASVEIDTNDTDPAEMVSGQQTQSTNQETDALTAVSAGGSVLPISIRIEKLDKTISVLNPTSRTIADLDEALLDGTVRHPDSATLEQSGNVFILGHSSYLPNVFNKNFQAFNGIQNLAWGDTIEVFSEKKVYVYRVEKVYRAKASDVTVPIAGTEHRLTLATCNSFGSVDDRYIVEAKQVAVKDL